MNIQTNVVYGMYSGLALLLDIYHPDTPNGYGIIHISGSGWAAPLGLDAVPLKESRHVAIEAVPLVEAGYTIFTINHRATPRFQYPAPFEDAQRAVRFIRYHAERYGIRADRIGAFGGSSGGQLVSMLALAPGAGDPEDESPINQVSASVQCVVTRAAPVNFTPGLHGTAAPPLLLRARIGADTAPNSVEARLARNASPLTYVTPTAPPFLLFHGDADDVVPFGQSEQMEAALREVGVPVQLVPIPGGAHGPGIMDDPGVREQVRGWFDRYLLERG